MRSALVARAALLLVPFALSSCGDATGPTAVPHREGSTLRASSVSEPGALVEALTVDAWSAVPVFSSASLQADATYRIEISGTYRFNTPFDARQADAEYRTEDGWASRLETGSVLDVLVAYGSVIGTPVSPGASGLTVQDVDWQSGNLDHTYHLQVAGNDGPIGFVVSDWWGGGGSGCAASHQGCVFDNAGTLTVSISLVDAPEPDPGDTPVGSDVVVTPLDATTGDLAPVVLTFDEVTSPGATTVASGPIGGGGPPAPTSHRLGQPPTYFDVETTAAFSGTVQLCIDYSAVAYGNESLLALLHFDATAGRWEDVTTSLDTGQETTCGAVSSLSPFLVAERNVAPEVTSVSLPAGPVRVDGPAPITASFTDANPGDTHTAVIDWGDGASTAGVVQEDAGVGTVEGDHAYSVPGVYVVAVTVTESVDPTSDLSGSRSSSEESTNTFVVVYDPDGGFVTGGGWIASPEGALTADPSATGKATFGFVSKYAKGASVPTGNTQFRFRAGALDFRSASYDWLVVNQGGTNAQYKGSGIVGGHVAPSGLPYRFMLWAADGDPDTFRIRIWYEDGGEVVVYDNGFDQALGGGSIRVHAN